MFCTFGELIKEIRRDQNLTLLEMSKILDVDNSLLGKIEANSRNPSAELINVISEKFDYSLDKLIIASYSDKLVEFLNRGPDDLKDDILKSFLNKIKNEVKRASQ
ncbi:helix-turn-helix transcriptional regulator [Chryseobacterium sp.]|uniref:helix-turn-helix domain-containing protein n=1 Tax=Chryseobacterium sp. TaxID=1871047 RepID=UPI0023F7DFB8|nr:helix-turn-helix transcriptional regulator [Chryseobacterium sp.]